MKVVENKKEETQDKKLTYEQLQEACGQLYQQNQYLTRQIQQLNTTNMFRRIDYLFLVLKYANSFGDAEFVNNCIDELKEALTIPEEEKKEED